MEQDKKDLQQNNINEVVEQPDEQPKENEGFEQFLETVEQLVETGDDIKEEKELSKKELRKLQRKLEFDSLYLSPEEVRKYKIKMGISKGLMYAFLTLVALFIVFPFLYMVTTSFKSEAEIVSDTFTFFPKQLLWENYETVLGMGGQNKGYSVLTMYKSTIIVSIFTTLGTIITTIFAAFAFSRLNFKGRETLFSLLLATMMIPGEIYIISNYQLLSDLKDTYIVLILPFMTSVFYTFYLRQSFRQIPNELYLASKVDGLGDFKYLFKVMIPIAKSSIITIIILSMIGTWNAYMWPSLMTSGNAPDKYLISNGLMNFFSATVSQYGPDKVINQQMAMSTLITIPLLAAFMLLRKYIMSGVGRSGIKG